MLNLSSRKIKYKHYILTKVLARDSDTAFMTHVGLQAFGQDNEGENQKESESDQVADSRAVVEASDAVAPNCQM